MIEKDGKIRKNLILPVRLKRGRFVDYVFSLSLLLL